MSSGAIVDESFPLEFSNEIEILEYLPENIKPRGYLVLSFDKNKKEKEQLDNFISHPYLKGQIPNSMLEKTTDFLMIDNNEIKDAFSKCQITTMKQYISKKTEYVDYSLFRIAY